MKAALGVRFAAAGSFALLTDAASKAGPAGAFEAPAGALAAGFGAALVAGFDAALVAGFDAAVVAGFAASLAAGLAATLTGAFAAGFAAATGALAAAFEAAAAALVVALALACPADSAAGLLVDAVSAVDFLVVAIRCSPVDSGW